MARKGDNGGPLWLWLLIGGVAVGLGFWWLADRFPGALSGQGEQAWAVHHLVLLAVLGGAVLVRVKSRPGTALKQAAVWVLIFTAVILAYSFRDDFAPLKDRVLAELLPGHGRVVADGREVVFRRSQGGHFAVEAMVDGTNVRFLVDTGASTVVLSPRDAERVGYDLDALDFVQPFGTANGVVYGAPIRLREIAVGAIAIRDLRASVNGAPMDTSLLGMSFLDRLSGYRIEGDTLTLVP